MINSFLSIKIDTAEDGESTMTQPTLAQTIIYNVDLENDSNQSQTLAISPPTNLR